MTDTPSITCQLITEEDRVNYTAALFGVNFPMRIEPFVFAMAEEMGHEYRGGLWQFFKTSNGAFFMAPDFDTNFTISCENGFNGPMSADALGITACLYAYSHLSFGEGEFAQTCAEHYHLLREYMYQHPEATAILGAID